MMFRICLQMLLPRRQIFLSRISEGRAENLNQKNGLSERRHCSCTSYGIYSPGNNRKNASFHFHRLENVCSCGKSFRIYSEATSRESKKGRIELSPATIAGSTELDREIRHSLRKPEQ